MSLRQEEGKRPLATPSSLSRSNSRSTISTQHSSVRSSAAAPLLSTSSPSSAVHGDQGQHYRLTSAMTEISQSETQGNFRADVSRVDESSAASDARSTRPLSSYKSWRLLTCILGNALGPSLLVQQASPARTRRWTIRLLTLRLLHNTPRMTAALVVDPSQFRSDFDTYTAWREVLAENDAGACRVG